MSAFNTEDLSTEINTILQKSGELMDASNSTLINIAPIDSLNTSSIENDIRKSLNEEFSRNALERDLIPRPHTLQDFHQKESLTEVTDVKFTLRLDELDEDDEIWIVDIPGTIDPTQLKGQMLQLGDKSKFKIGEEKYSAVTKDCKSSITCVFKTDALKTVKAVNIKPAGSISIRRKLSGIPKKKIQYEKSRGVPYPQNIKLRHPLFGVQVEKSIVKIEN